MMKISDREVKCKGHKTSIKCNDIIRNSNHKTLTQLTSLFSTKKNKRGWLMILEAFIAIMILMGFFVATIQRQTPKPNIAANVYKIQQQILWEASDDNTVREDVIENNVTCSLENFVYRRIPPAFDYHVQTCHPPGLCPLTLSSSEAKPTGDIFVNDRILSTTLREYNPTVIQLFFWYGSPHVPNCTVTVPYAEGKRIFCPKAGGVIVPIFFPKSEVCLEGGNEVAFCDRVVYLQPPQNKIFGFYNKERTDTLPGTECNLISPPPVAPCELSIDGCQFKIEKWE